MFFTFLKMLKSFTGHYRVAGQTSFDLTALKKKTFKIRKIQKKFSECKNIIRFDFHGFDLPIPLEKSKIGDMSGSDFFEGQFQKKSFQKLEKNRKNAPIAKIFADSE